MRIYLIGSLKNPKIPEIGKTLRSKGYEVYDEWHCPGSEADENWQAYCKFNGLTYAQALEGWHAKQIYEIDKFHLDRADVGILVWPCGKSGHLEGGYLIGKGRKCYILLEGEPDRYDIMTRMMTKVCPTLETIIKELVASQVPHSIYNEEGRCVECLANAKERDYVK